MENKRKSIHYGFVIIICCCLMMGVNIGLSFSCAGIFYKPVSESLGVGVGLFGIYMSVMYVAATLFLPFAGKLLERYSARWLFAGSSALMGLVFLAFAALNAVWEFYAVAVALGVSVAFQLYLSFPTLVNRWFSVKVGLMMGICTAASGIGGMLFSPLIALMITDWGWRWAYAACGLLILCVVSPLLALLLRSRPEEKGLRKYGEGSAAPMRAPNATPAKGDNSQTGKGRTGSASIQGSVTYAQAVRMPVFYDVLLFSFLMMAVSTLNLFIPNYFESLGYTLEQASYAAAAVMAGVTVGKLLLGHINDRNTLFGVLLSTLGGRPGPGGAGGGRRPGPGAVRLRAVRPGLFGRDGADGHAHAQGVRPGALRPHLLDGVDSACSRRRLGVRWLGTAPGGYLLHLHHGCGSRRTGHLRHPRRRRPEGPERRRLTFNKC